VNGVGNMKNIYLAIMIGAALLGSGCSKPKPDAAQQASSAPSVAVADSDAQVPQPPPAASEAPPVASASASAEAEAPASATLEADAGKGHHKADAGARGLARWDKDGDGRVTREEAPAKLKKRFDKVDTNHDGVIDATEMAASGHGKGRGKGHGKGKGHGDGGHGKQDKHPPAEDTEEP
jgi:HlyD family secretion protein